MRGLRRGMTWVHRAAGLFLGLIVSVLGLSGAVLVWADEWEPAFTPMLRTQSTVSGPVATPSMLVDAISAHAGRAPRQLRMPSSEGRPAEAWLDARGQERMYLHPQSAKILGARRFDEGVRGRLRSLHFTLLQGETGETLVGICGIALLLLSFSGLVLWWPGMAKLAAGFRLQRPLAGWRGHYDVHKIVGALVAPGLAVAGLTGAALVFQKPLESALRAAGANIPRPPSAPVLAKGAALPLERLLVRAEEALPGLETTRMDLPVPGERPLRVRRHMPGELHPVGLSSVLIDSVTGEVIWKYDVRTANVGARIFASRYPVHIGRWGGVTSRVLATGFGLAPSVLFVTGVALWWLRGKRGTRLATTGRPCEPEASLSL